MFPSGIIVLFFTFFLRSPYLHLSQISLKYLIATILFLRIDYFISFGFDGNINQPFIFHSIFTGIIIFILVKTKETENLKVSSSKSFILGFAACVLASMFLGLAPINHFWPIPDSDLSFSLMAGLFFSESSKEFIGILYLLIEFISLFFYGKFLAIQIVLNNGNAIDIKRISNLIKIQKYLFMALLFIFFVTYLMNLASFQPLFALSYISYLIVIIANIYMTLKTDFKYVG